MTVYQQLLNKQTKLSVIGLGYVGMPIAIAFAKHVDTIGYDYNPHKIDSYLQGIDPTNEVGDQAIKETSMTFTNDPSLLKESLFHIVAVPTPINLDKTPDLTPITSATKTVAQHLQKGAIVVYESTVYPGVTEDVCIPLLEEISGLKCGKDFAVGYSPERINPGDKVNTLENIVKIVSATDDKALDELANIYSIVIKAGIHKASEIKVAEAAKVVENSQRDINIAFMNELALVFDRMNIDTQDVIDAMNTKWNALGFTPGLVGGHCIGVDPYYFLHEAEKLGYHSQIILSGRQVNDSMGEFVADSMIKSLVSTGKKVIDAKVAIFGLTFKENTPDIRNSKVIDIITRLNQYGIKPLIVDPYADNDEAMAEYGVNVTPLEEVGGLDGLIFAVPHHDFINLSPETIESFYRQDLPNDERVLHDVKSALNKDYFVNKNYHFWRL